MQAILDNDHVWGIITKTAVNQDGHSVSPITKPSVTQQEELLRRIYTKADLAHVQYIEAHGTGTPVGDATEAQSISNVVAKAKLPGSEKVCIGSVKGNIGHTESAAGVAGLIKVLLMMKHETFVPSVFYSEDTAGVDAQALNIRIPKEVEKWEASSRRVAGVNNFGFGGTNAHAIVKQHQQSGREKGKQELGGGYFVISANSPKSLTLMMEDVIKEVDENVDVESLAYTSACRRSHQKHKYRKAFWVSSAIDLEEKLKMSVARTISASSLAPRLVFVFCGNGVTYRGMCKQLLEKVPAFWDKIREISLLFQSLSPLNVLETLESESGDYDDPQVVQPLLFAVQVGICALLRQWGVKPDAILGHSVGEVAAAHCAGLLSLQDAVKVIHARSFFQSKVAGGKMLVISNMNVSEVAALLPQCSGSLSLAAFNSPQSCTVSGDGPSVENLHASLSTSANEKNLFLRILNVPAAYHSPMMDPILPEVKKTIGSLCVSDLHTELFSTVTGEQVQPGDFCTGEYWARNIREPVFFEQAVRSAAMRKKNIIFLEVGPRRALQRNIVETLGSGTAVLASVQPEKDHESMRSVVGQLFQAGVNVDWKSLYRGHERLPLPIPRYHFDCSDRDIIIGAAKINTRSDHPVLCHTGGESNVFSCDLKSHLCFYLREHRHNEVPIIPGAFYAELGLAAFMARADPKVPLSSLQLTVSFHSPFILSQNSPEMKVQLQESGSDTSFRIMSLSALYASGRVVSNKEMQIEEPFISLSSIYRRCKSVMSSQQLYSCLAQGGFQYGDVFQNKSDVYYGEDLKEALSVVQVPEELQSQLHDYCIHPVVLDFLMQILPVAVRDLFAGRPGFPAEIGSLTVFEPLQDEMIVYVRATKVGVSSFEVCGCFADKEGRVLVEVKHAVVKYLGSPSQVVEEYFYHNTFSDTSEDATSSPPPKALVFCDSTGIANVLKICLDPQSVFVHLTHAEFILSHGFSAFMENFNIIDMNFEELLFMWGTEDLTSQEVDLTLQRLTNCCEVLRQIVLKLKQIHFPNAIRTVTYCSSDITVDHINAGFALLGMTRSFAAEMPDLQFQLIDMSSHTVQDIGALIKVLRSYPCNKYPELVVKDGQILKPTIVRTKPAVIDHATHSLSFMSMPVIFQTAEALKMSRLTAIECEGESQPTNDASVEIQMSKICVHSSDYFPVSLSHLKFGQTLYWNKHSSQNHKLLSLDFCGMVTAVGKKVRKVKVGDFVAVCYPAAAESRVCVPEDVCYSTKQLPFLQRTPCVSYFVLAWEILHRALPRAKSNLVIISSVPDSTLVKVLQMTFCKSGWHAIVNAHCSDSFTHVGPVSAVVVLPPFDESLIANIGSVPGVQNLVLVCESQSQRSVAPDVLQIVNQSVCVQKIKMPFLLQKGYLKAEKPHIYQWLKSLKISRTFSIESSTFLNSKREYDRNSEQPSSYFHSQKLAVVALRKDSGTTSLSDIDLLPTKKLLFKERAIYIVAGGLSGLGFETVKFISQRGGKHIVTLSRSKPQPDVQQEIHTVEKQCGSCIIPVECDVSVFESVQKMIFSIKHRFPDCPIRGVFHSAVVLHDGLIESLNQSLYEKVFKPKVNGALNLHRATKHCQLDYFVCYSSISAFLGNASQTNYAAANTFLDVFCHLRRRLGLPGQSINWGALNLGLLLNKQNLHQFLEAKGISVLDVADIHKCLEQCLVLNLPQQAVCKFHFRNIRYNVLSQNVSLTSRLSNLVEEAVQKSNEINFERKETKSKLPRDYLVSLLTESMGLDESELKGETPLSSLGIDSMQAMTLQNVIFQERNVSVPLVKLLDQSATLSTLVSILSVKNESEDLSEGSRAAASMDIAAVSTRL